MPSRQPSLAGSQKTSSDVPASVAFPQKAIGTTSPGRWFIRTGSPFSWLTRRDHLRLSDFSNRVRAEVVRAGVLEELVGDACEDDLGFEDEEAFEVEGALVVE